MAKHPKPDRDTAALFVRLPVEEAEKLDRIAFRLKTPKREVVRQLLSELDPESADVMWERPAPPPVTVPLPGPGTVVGHASSTPASPDDVLDAAAVAELLSTDEGAIVALADAGELPGRQVGGQWRFLRRAVLAWLGGDPQRRSGSAYTPIAAWTSGGACTGPSDQASAARTAC